MKASDIKSNWARLAFVLMAAMWGAMGSYILYAGHFVKGYKFSTETIVVEGFGAFLMGAIFLFLAAIAIFIVLQSLHAGRRAYYWALAIILGFPCLLLLSR